MLNRRELLGLGVRVALATSASALVMSEARAVLVSMGGFELKYDFLDRLSRRDGGRPAPAAPGPDVHPAGREGHLENVACRLDQAFLPGKTGCKLPQVNPRAGNGHDEAAIDEDLQEHFADHIHGGPGQSPAVEAAQTELLDPFRIGRVFHRYRLSLSVL